MPNSVIPEGYEDREYSADAWRESVINNAVERALLHLQELPET